MTSWDRGPSLQQCLFKCKQYISNTNTMTNPISLSLSLYFTHTQIYIFPPTPPLSKMQTTHTFANIEKSRTPKNKGESPAPLARCFWHKNKTIKQSIEKSDFRNCENLKSLSRKKTFTKNSVHNWSTRGIYHPQIISKTTYSIFFTRLAVFTLVF